MPKAYGWPEDGALALTYLELAAHSVGAGVCWGGFVTTAARNYAKLRDFLGINENEHICGAQMLGYPLLKPARQFPPRKEIDRTVNGHAAAWLSGLETGNKSQSFSLKQ